MKKHLKIMIACILALCVILSTSGLFGVFADPLDGITVAEGSQNLLTNGSFETDELFADSEDNTALISGWTVIQSGVDFALSTDVKDGKRALSATHTVAGSNFVLRPENADIDGILDGFESGIYNLSLYAKGSGTLVLRYRDATVATVTEKPLALANEWQALSLETLVIGASGKVQFELYSAADSGSILIDNISLTKYTGLQNGNFESDTGYTVPQALYDFSNNVSYNYTSIGNVLENSGFEDTAEYKNTTSQSWNKAVITKGWTTNYSGKNFVFSIVDDTHSGKHAIRVDLPPAAESGNDTRLFANKDLIADADLKGRMTGLEPNQTYLVSYWVKGSAQSRIYGKKLTDVGTENGDIRDSWVNATSEWVLVTEEISSNALGQAWWNININRVPNIDSYLVIDDVSMQTKAEAIASVEAMIEALSLNSAYAAQAVSDINQWVALLGKANISNYDVFDVKLNGPSEPSSPAPAPEETPEEDVYVYSNLNNILNNSGFEESDAAVNVSGSYKEFTSGWMVSDEMKSNNTAIEITNDAHSGKNALKVSGINSKEYRFFNTVANKSNSTLAGITEDLEADTTYLVSYWVKGSGDSRVYAKKYASGSWNNDWGTKLVNPGNAWTLYTKEVKTSATGDAWCNVYLYANSGTELYVDDILMQTKAEAVANVEAMIDALDVNTSYSARAIEDIRQWVAALGESNISNYDVLVAKTSIGKNNIHNNPGFEASDAAVNVSGSYKEFTTGWMLSDEMKSSNTAIEITNNSHSGKNALKITGIKAKEYRIFSTVANASNSTLAGITESLEADTTYLVSYWVKGNGDSRVYAKKYASGSWNNDWGTKLVNPGDTWTLYAKEVQTNSSGDAWYNVFVNANAGTEIYIDDISMQTKAQAVADVVNMIKAFNPSADNAIKTASDIEQWINALGSGNISNYNDFVTKSALISNPSFELSDSAALINGNYTSITTGWKTNYVSTSIPYSIEIVKDAYSGNNALKVNVDKVDNGSGFRIVGATATNTSKGATSGYKADTEYLVSYWVKGTADTKVFAKKGENFAQNDWQANVASNADTWALNGYKVKSDLSGNAWWCVFVVGNEADKYAIVDDITCIPVTEVIANVEAMISAFDYTKATADEVYKIQQWMNIVTVSNEAETLFEEKLADYNALQAELNWKGISGVFGWEANTEGKVSVDTADIAYGNKALKIDATSEVGLRPTQVPFGMQNGYYMLVFWAKGGGDIAIKATANNDAQTLEVINESMSLSSGWKKYVIKDINIKENYVLNDLRFILSNSSEIYLDAVQLYRQIGPGSQLDDITSNVVENTLTLGASPDGYYTALYKISNTEVLSTAGNITVPQYNTNVEYRFKVININDETDYAVSGVKVITVAGTDGELAVDNSVKKTVRTLTDKKTGVSVTAKMSDAARLTVKVLDENSDYYDLLLNYGYECIAHYNIFTIPQSAYEGDRTFTFTVDDEYNGKNLIVTRYDKETRALEEYSVKVVDGKITVTTSNDGAFMIQKLSDVPPEEDTPSEDTPSEDTPSDDEPEEDVSSGGEQQEDTSSNGESDNKEENNSSKDSTTDNDSGSDKNEETDKKDESDKEDNTSSDDEKDNDDNDSDESNKQVVVKKKGNSKLLWIIIIIGLGALLLLILFTVVVIVLRRRREQETVEGSDDISVQ